MYPTTYSGLIGTHWSSSQPFLFYRLFVIDEISSIIIGKIWEVGDHPFSIKLSALLRQTLNKLEVLSEKELHFACLQQMPL